MKHCPNPECMHLEETGRAGEFRDDIVTCSDCGTTLAGGEPPEMDLRGQMRWTAIAEVPDPHAAHLVKSALAMEGIASELRRKTGGSQGIVPGKPAAAEVIVPDHMAEAARKVLEERPDAPVALPDDDDLEFLDEDGNRIEVDAEEESPSALTDPGASNEDWPTCPRCKTASVTHLAPDAPEAIRGFFKRVFSSRPRWTCLACRHQW
ncbi:MAG: DUF2007 domain-containing protein [Acidobacteria bacterium]|nr:DUF2007 domain-containing protein [Acidobacteriota bacterium]